MAITFGLLPFVFYVYLSTDNSVGVKCEIMNDAYQWQGTPCSVRFGYVDQQENSEKLLYWYNFECYNKQEADDSFKRDHMVKDNGKHFSLIPAIEITQGKSVFIIANHFGIGVSKLIKGGWPNHTHFSLDGIFKETIAPYFAFKSFDLELYENHESERRNWQKREYPVDFEKMEQFRASMRMHMKGLTK